MGCVVAHLVFSRARHERFRQSDALRRVFESVVAKCIAAGLVGGEGFSIDASLIRADVDKKKRTPGDQPIDWPKAEKASRAVREYLTALDAAQNRAKNSEDDDKFDGGSRRKPPKEVSLTDPQAAWVENTDPFSLTMPIISSTTKSASSSTPRAPAPVGSLRSPLRGPCWIGSGGAFTFDHSGSQPTLLMVQSGCSSGWWTVR